MRSEALSLPVRPLLARVTATPVRPTAIVHLDSQPLGITFGGSGDKFSPPWQRDAEPPQVLLNHAWIAGQP